MNCPKLTDQNHPTMSVTKTSKIDIEIGLDAENVPILLRWQAEDNPQQDGMEECKAMLLALFDKRTQDTLKIDLWTKEMQVGEMDRFFYQTLRGLADTYFKATQNQQLASQFRQFVEHFGKETKVVQAK